MAWSKQAPALALIIMHGFSGLGTSTYAGQLVEALRRR